ncbi:MAG: 4'-phosphopantetheinyl transferase superfamily protein [Lachnospiraceae bacterium]|nr:4'-phosphopantetheinyl transferase superfamily protein [Lachnospiraceae bacterium]
MSITKIYEDIHSVIYFIETDQPQTKKEDRKQRKSSLLSKVLNVDENALQLGEHGKPFLKDGSRFISISHDDNVSVLAVSDINIGVDIERIGEAKMRIVKRFFPPSFKDAVESTSGEDRNRVFYEKWTIIEAILKADGSGFHRDINEDPAWIFNWKTVSFEHEGFMVSLAYSN